MDQERIMNLIALLYSLLCSSLQQLTCRSHSTFFPFCALWPNITFRPSWPRFSLLTFHSPFTWSCRKSHNSNHVHTQENTNFHMFENCVCISNMTHLLALPLNCVLIAQPICLCLCTSHIHLSSYMMIFLSYVFITDNCSRASKSWRSPRSRKSRRSLWSLFSRPLPRRTG